MRRVVWIGAAFWLCLSCSSAYGWGRDGHRMTGDIASRYLTPAAAYAVQDLLGEQTLADVSTWADEIKSDRSYDWARPWHYVNVNPGMERFVLERDCPEHGCVVSAIIKYAEVLRSETADRAEKKEALKFLVHFVGDLHQPLHVGYARDRGGNDVAVDFFGSRTNLHFVWDVSLIARRKIHWKRYADELYRAIEREQRRAWSKSLDPSDWATESFHLAERYAYAIPDDARLEQAYYDRVMPVVDERLAQAGVRLAAMLNDIFKEPIAAEASRSARTDRSGSADE